MTVSYVFRPYNNSDAYPVLDVKCHMVVVYAQNIGITSVEGGGWYVLQINLRS